MPDALVSVIVPIYNMAPWLDRCLESVVGQTYPNLEILLIDDGSTDGSAALCDAWAERDHRIRVLHKANGGLSDARNAGMDAARGDYFCFVDADDWAELSMIGTLLAAIEEYGADMAVSGTWEAYDTYMVQQCRGTGGTAVLDQKAVFEAVVRQHLPAGGTSVWSKLYARRLWDGVRFPVGRLCEDRYVRSLIYARCQKVAVVEQALYYYYQRRGSIMNPMTEQQYRRLASDYVQMLLFDGDQIKKLYPELEAAVNALSVDLLMNFTTRNCQNEARQQPKIGEEIIQTFRRYRKGTWKYLRRRSKIKYLLFSVSPRLYYYTGWVYKRLKYVRGEPVQAEGRR